MIFDTLPSPSGPPLAPARRRSLRRAGHSSVVTVLDRYGHLFPGSEDKVNEALDAMAARVSDTASITTIG